MFELIADGLAERGYAVTEGFLSPQETDQLLDLDEFRQAMLHFRKAGIGKQTEFQVNEQVRGDYIQWIDPKTAPAPVALYLERLHALRLYLNRALYLSLKDAEVHMTSYPAGAFYKRHLDQFKSDDHRKLSVICYLNKNWLPDNGGQLRMYLEKETKDILPLAGTMVCFRSDMIEHEVLPSTRERLSITGWMTD